MTPTPETPTVITKPVQKQIFDLDSFSEVTLAKTFSVQPVASYAEFLARMNNDSAKVLELLNEALVSAAREAARNSNDGWHTYKVDESGEPTKELNGAYTGTPADAAIVNQLVLTLAKTVFGYSKDLPVEKKQAAKEKAKNMIKGNEEMKAGLKANMSAIAQDEA